VEALGWGALAASSLLIGAALAFARPWTPGMIGVVLAFGVGALISAVSFELAEEGLAVGSAGSLGAGLAAGALTYYLLDGMIARHTDTGHGRPGRRSGERAGQGLALGAFLDGVPEQLVLGIGLASGEAVSIALLVAIFVSNLPEGVGSASDMASAGRPRSEVLRLFGGVSVVCAAATVLGYAVADAMGGELEAFVDGFAAGALLVMLIDSMAPEALAKGGRRAGLVTVLGFALATALSKL
jgi:zinc transporter, ZIP family